MNLKVKKKVLAIIYRKRDGRTEFLALRNNPHNLAHGGNFYFVVTGGVDGNENLQDAVKREIKEETGIIKILQIIDLNKICEYTCASEVGYLCREAEFLVEVGDDVIRLNKEHVDFKWLEKNAFVELVDWNDKDELTLILNKNKL